MSRNIKTTCANHSTPETGKDKHTSRVPPHGSTACSPRSAKKKINQSNRQLYCILVHMHTTWLHHGVPGRCFCLVTFVTTGFEIGKYNGTWINLLEDPRLRMHGKHTHAYRYSSTVVHMFHWVHSTVLLKPQLHRALNVGYIQTLSINPLLVPVSVTAVATSWLWPMLRCYVHK